MNFNTNLVLLVAKDSLLLSLAKISWMQRLILMCNSQMAFLSTKQLMKEHIPAMFVKTMEQYVLPLVGKCETVSITFDL